MRKRPVAQCVSWQQWASQWPRTFPGRFVAAIVACVLKLITKTHMVSFSCVEAACVHDRTSRYQDRIDTNTEALSWKHTAGKWPRDL